MVKDAQRRDAYASARRLRRLFMPDHTAEEWRDNTERTVSDGKDRDRKFMRGLLPDGPASYSGKNIEGSAENSEAIE